MKHVNIKLTVDEAVALNNFTIKLCASENNAAINRAAKKLLASLNAVDPIEPPAHTFKICMPGSDEARGV